MFVYSENIQEITEEVTYIN